MNHRITLLPLLLALACAPAEDPGDDDVTAEVGPEATAYVEAVVGDLLRGVGWVADNSHGLTVGYALSAHGTDQSLLGSASMMFACEDPVTYDGYCDDAGEEFGGALFCLRLTCEEGGNWLSETWLADPGASEPTDPSQRHALTLATTAPSGALRYAESPLFGWHLSEVDDAVTVTAALDEDAELELDGGALLDVGFGAAVSMTRDASYEPLDLAIAVEFPALTDVPVEVEVGLGANLLPEGVVSMDGEPAGVVSFVDGVAVLAWDDAP